MRKNVRYHYYVEGNCEKKLIDELKTKILHLIITILIMLVVSRFVIRLVDATVQIDDDIGMLILLLVIVNAIIAGLSLYVFRKMT